MNHKFDLLKAQIFQRSAEKTYWEQAILEWDHIGTRELNGARCLCSQPIEIEHLIRHHHTGEEVSVGSVCIFRFMGHNIELVKKAQRAEYERTRRVCDRCAEWTRHPEYCKKCKREMQRLENGWHECNSFSCVEVLREPGYCKKCVLYLEAKKEQEYMKYLELERMRKRIEEDRRLERIQQQQKEDEEWQAAKMRDRVNKYNKVVALINMNSLNEIERKFVTESVRNYIIGDRKLTDKQRAWLKAIIQKHSR